MEILCILGFLDVLTLQNSSVRWEVGESSQVGCTETVGVLHFRVFLLQAHTHYHMGTFMNAHK